MSRHGKFLWRATARSSMTSGRDIAKETSAARELADSLYADSTARKRERASGVSKLASYTGRGSLEGWLRTVMAQEFVNRYRRQRRLVSLEERRKTARTLPRRKLRPMIAWMLGLEPRPMRSLSQFGQKIDSCSASYYLDGRTLRLGLRVRWAVHESTISRRVDKLANRCEKRSVRFGSKRLTRPQLRDAL